MKMIYLANFRIPTEKAHGYQIMKMCESFALKNIEVELVAPRRFTPIKDDFFIYYDIKSIFKIIKLPCLDLFFLHSFWPKLSAKIQTGILLIQTTTFLLFSKVYLSFRKFDTLYTREQFAGLLFNDFILEIHSLPKKTKFFHKIIWGRAKLLVVLTSFIKERLIREGVLPEKIVVAPDGVDLKEFDIDISRDEAGKRLNLPQDKILIGYVGMLRTMGMEKGVDVAIRALKFLEKNILLVLVGGGEEDVKFYLNLAKNSDLEDRVIFVGRVAHRKIPFYLKAFDILIAPFPENEHYNYFMSPLKIFEYMASGRVIVASDLPAIREILNKDNAVLVEPGSSEKLAEAVKNLIEDSNLKERLAREAYLNAQNYTWGKRVNNILNFLK